MRSQFHSFPVTRDATVEHTNRERQITGRRLPIVIDDELYCMMYDDAPRGVLSGRGTTVRRSSDWAFQGPAVLLLAHY